MITRTRTSSLRRRTLGLVSLLLACVTGSAWAQGAPQVVWIAPNPSSLDSNAGAVAWSPSGSTVVAVQYLEVMLKNLCNLEPGRYV